MKEKSTVKEQFLEFLWQECDDSFINMWNGKTAPVTKSDKILLLPNTLFLQSQIGYVARKEGEKAEYNSKLNNARFNNNKRVKTEEDEAEQFANYKNARAKKRHNTNTKLLKAWNVLGILASIAVGILGIVITTKLVGEGLRGGLIAMCALLIPFGVIILGNVISKALENHHKSALILTSIVTVWIVAAGIVPLALNAHQEKFYYLENPVLYTIQDNMAVVTGFNADAPPKEKIVIPEMFKGYKVKKIATDAFKNAKHVTEISVPDMFNIGSIEKGAFSGCESLQSIDLPFCGNTLNSESMSDESKFAYIFNVSPSSKWNFETGGLPKTLTKVRFRGGVVRPSALAGAKYIKDVTLPKDLEIIETAVFGNSGIEEFTMPNSVKQIGGAAFYGAPLKRIYFPQSSIVAIGPNAFNNPQRLEVYLQDYYYLGLKETSFNYSATTFYCTNQRALDEYQDFFNSNSWSSVAKLELLDSTTTI